MASWESRRDTLPGNMLGRKMPGAASRRENTREASCQTLSLIFGAPQSVARTLLQRGMIAVGWHSLADEARCFDPTSLGARSSTPQRVNRLRGTVGQEHSGHEAMLTARAAAHESSRVLDSSGSSTRNTEAPPEFRCRRTCDVIDLGLDLDRRTSPGGRPTVTTRRPGSRLGPGVSHCGRPRCIRGSGVSR